MIRLKYPSVSQKECNKYIIMIVMIIIIIIIMIIIISDN